MGGILQKEGAARLRMPYVSAEISMKERPLALSLFL